MDFWELVKADKIQEVSHMLKHTHRLNIDILGRIFHDSPLMVAIKNGNIEMMQLLIDNGADCNLKCPDPLYLGHTPLFFATKTLHACGLHMMKILIDNGASTTVVGARGHTLLHLLFSDHHRDPSDADNRLWLLLDNIPRMDIGRLITQKDWNGNTASDLNRKANAVSIADILDIEVQRRRDCWISKRRVLTDQLRPECHAPMSILKDDVLQYIIDLCDHEFDT